MATEGNSDFQTVLGADASFKGELTFEKGVRILGKFEGQVKTPGSLHIAEGAKVGADVEAGILRVEGELKGNVNVSGKLSLTNSGRMEGDLRTNRLEIADGAVFIGNVSVGNGSTTPARRNTSGGAAAPAGGPARSEGSKRNNPEPVGSNAPTVGAPGR
ncbi:MAG: polymer-forming cytoskeletal protein [Phycisphaerae bacterium]